MPPIPPPYDRTPPTGPGLDNKTRAALQVVERDLGYELTIVQPSYSSGVGASAGTHSGGGVVDLAPWDHRRKVRALRDRGWAAWYRGTRRAADGSLIWNPHIHAVLIEHGKLSLEARAQVDDYLHGLNGLADDGRDPNPYRPDPAVVFDYAAAVWDSRRRIRIAGIKARRASLRDTLSALQSRIVYKRKVVK